MNTTQIIVTLGGVALSIFIAWFFWFAPKGKDASGRRRERRTRSGGHCQGRLHA